MPEEKKKSLKEEMSVTGRYAEQAMARIGGNPRAASTVLERLDICLDIEEFDHLREALKMTRDEFAYSIGVPPWTGHENSEMCRSCERTRTILPPAFRSVCYYSKSLGMWMRHRSSAEREILSVDLVKEFELHKLSPEESGYWMWHPEVGVWAKTTVPKY